MSTDESLTPHELLEDAKRVIRETTAEVTTEHLAELDQAVAKARARGADGAEIMTNAYGALERAVKDEHVLLAADALYLGARLLVGGE